MKVTDDLKIAVNLTFGILFSIQLAVWSYLAYKHPLEDLFMRKGSFWNFAGMLSRVVMCFITEIFLLIPSVSLKDTYGEDIF